VKAKIPPATRSPDPPELFGASVPILRRDRDPADFDAFHRLLRLGGERRDEYRNQGR
jgi:hypothetical protein